MPSKQTVTKTIFLLIVAVSSIFLVTSTSNYVNFFLAVERFNLKVLYISPSVEQENVNITLAFSICNPTSYVGLKLREFSYTLFYEVGVNTTALYGDSISFARAPEPIDPYWNKTFEREINLNPNQESTKLFKSFYESTQGQINWILQGTAILITFGGTLDAPVGDEFASNL